MWVGEHGAAEAADIGLNPTLIFNSDMYNTSLNLRPFGESLGIRHSFEKLILASGCSAV